MFFRMLTKSRPPPFPPCPASPMHTRSQSNASPLAHTASKPGRPVCRDQGSFVSSGCHPYLSLFITGILMGPLLRGPLAMSLYVLI